MPLSEQIKHDRPAVRGRWVACLALAAAFAAPGCNDTSSADVEPRAATPEAQEEAIAISVEPVRRTALSAFYGTSATLRADRRATVTARTRGVIHELLVEEGDAVEAGQALAVLENDEQRIAVARAVSARETTEREHERARKLHEQDLLSEEAYETTRRAAIEARHAADLAELNLSRTVIHAPFSGVVLQRHLDVGGNVSDGTEVYDLADLDPLYADVSVPERQIGRLAVGQRVRLILDASGEAVAARIERLAPFVDSETGTVKVTVAAPATSGLRPGGFVRVEIVTETHADAVVVPRAALIAEGRRWHVFRLNATGDRVERLEVTRGFEEGDRVEILAVVGAAAALVPGERVVAVGASALTDDAYVEVIDPDAPDSQDTDATVESTDVSA